MSEFTLRNKSTTPILTLRPATLALFLSARPESTALVFNKIKLAYKNLTGKTLSLDYAQTQQLLERANADDRGMWYSKYSGLEGQMPGILECFRIGYLQSSSGYAGVPSVELKLVEAFYDMVDKFTEQTT